MAQPADAPIKAYWQPGCTSCLRMKEFLTRHGVPFVSVNVLEDRAAMAELAELGVRSVPIIRRGSDWANGQVLRDVARVAGIRWGDTPILAPAELVSRLTTIQSAAQRYLRQIPEERLGDMLPNRPRSYGQLVYHIFNIADAFLEHEMQGLPLREGAYNRVQAPGTSKGQLAGYGQDVLERLGGWWDEAGNSTDLRGQGQGLLRRRHAARIPGAHHLALGPARAPADDGAGQARHRPRRAARRGHLRRPADARQGLGRRAAGGVMSSRSCPNSDPARRHVGPDIAASSGMTSTQPRWRATPRRFP